MTRRRETRLRPGGLWFYAVLQVAVWLTFALASWLVIRAKLPAEQHAAVLVAELTMVPVGIAITSVLLLMSRRLERLRFPPWLRIGLLAAATLIAASYWPVLDRRVIAPLIDSAGLVVDWVAYSRASRSNYSMTLLAWLGGFLALDHWILLQRRERALLEYQVLSRDAQLRALYYQLNPHFLFNTLNSIRALILEDPERARSMVTRLSAFLRETLTQDPRPIPLSDELRRVRAYLDIERERFDTTLDVDWQIEPGLDTVHLPPLLLQPLVENAIRHGDAGGDGMVHVRIEAARVNGSLRITVANTGSLSGAPGDAEAGGAGVGIENVRSRLAQAYPGGHRFELREGGGWVRAIVEIDRSAASPGAHA